MSPLVFVLSTSLLAGMPRSAPGLSAAELAVIRQTHAATETMVGPKADWAAWAAAHYAPDATMLPPNGPAVVGREAIARLMASFPPITAFSTEDVEVAGVGDLAYIRGTYRMTLSPPQGAPIEDVGKYIEIWRRQPDGSWRCTTDIFNSDLSP